MSDTGIGIPDEQSDRIFKRFSQADSSTSRRFGGSGLGLSICKSLVELMGGSIGFYSQQGVGSEFWFDVSLSRTVQLTTDAAETSIDEASPRSLLLIFLAEDIAVNQELAVAHKLGHEVDVVSDGRSAVEAALERRYDLILMDVNMPIMDGLMATTEIRARENPSRRVPIVALTADVLTDQVERAKRSGMDDHLGKPFLPRQLKAMLDRWGGRPSIFEKKNASEAPSECSQSWRHSLLPLNVEMILRSVDWLWSFPYLSIFVSIT